MTTNPPTAHQRIPEHTQDEAWIRAFLHRAQVGHLAHSQGEQPFVTPVNYWFDEANHRIIFHGSPVGKMRENLKQNPNACLEVSEHGRFLPSNTALEFGIQYRSVMVFGTVQKLQDEEERRATLYALLARHFPQYTPGKEYRPITAPELARTAVYALHIQHWSGKENWKDQAEQSAEWAPLPELSPTPAEPTHPDLYNPRPSQIVMYFAPWCPDSRRAQRVLQENNTPHLPIDIGKDNRAHRFVDSLTRRVRVPTILFPDGSLLIEPSNEALRQKIKSTSL